MSTAGELERGREAYAGRAWIDARESLTRADALRPLGGEDLELLATAGYMLGRDDEHIAGLERAHDAWLAAGQALRAARCAFWIGIHLATRGEMGRASGWLARSQRLVDDERRECVEQGYLLLPASLELEGGGDYLGSAAAAGEAAETGRRFGDSDLFALAVHQQGCALVKHGRVAEGVALLDEAMLAVTAGSVSPIVSGLVYCGVILGCRDAHDLRRAQEWTAALSDWCDNQPDMVAFSGTCRVHRAEIMQVRGAWHEAREEATLARERCEQARNDLAAGESLYLLGELHRLQGEFAAAEAAYREAGACGREPQPGLALLRLAQGETGAATGAIGRVLAETTEGPRRARLLAASVEIALASGDTEAARRACRELAGIAASYRSATLDATVSQASGAVELADGDPGSALAALRRALRGWHALDAPYEAARTRVLVGLACRALGDEEAAGLELAAARDAFTELGAGPDLARLDVLTGKAGRENAHGLTPRELQVLRMVAAGATNHAIASELVLSDRTVDRHVSNIFAKLGLSSRAAATAYAYEHELVRPGG